MAAHVGLDPARTSTGSPSHSVDPLELFAEGKIDAFLGFPPEPQELRARQIGHVIVNTRGRPPLVAVFLLHAGGQPGICPQISGRDQARDARHPQGCRPLRHRPAARARSGSSMAVSPTRYDYALQTLNELPTTNGGNTTPRTRCASTRCGCTRRADQVEPAEDHRRGHRLALSERAQTRAEGVSAKAREGFRCR